MSTLQPGLDKRLATVRARFDAAIQAAHRAPESVTLIAVSKTFPISAAEAAWQLGQRHFGENYVQEGIEKVEYFRRTHPTDAGIWHFIGPLQSNKTRAVAEHFDWVHSVDRLKIARRLSEQRPAALGKLNVLIEVNVSAETSKSGVTPQEVPALALEISKLPNLALRGLMCIPAPADTPEAQRAPLHALAELMASLATDFPEMDTLSMGMSADMEAAIAEGATFVRVGSAIFGPRDYGHKEA